MYKWVNILKASLVFILITEVVTSTSLAGESDKKSHDEYQIVLRMDENRLLNFFINMQAVQLRSYLDGKSIMYADLHIRDDRSIYFALLDQNDISHVKKTLNNIYSHYPGCSLINKKLSFTLSFSNKSIPFIKTNAIRDAIKIIDNRLDEFGLSGQEVKSGDKETIEVKVKLYGHNTETEKKRIEKLITDQGALMFMEVVGRARTKEISGTEDIIMIGSGGDKKYLLRAIPVAVVSKVKDARVSFTSNNVPIVTFSLNKYDMKIVSDFTEKNIGKELAIVINDKVYDVISIKKGFTSKWKGQISNNFKIQDAHDVAIILRSGAMIVPLINIRKIHNNLEVVKKESNPCKSKVFIDLKISASEAFQKNNYMKSLKLFKKAHHICPSDKEVESIVNDLENTN